MKRTIIAIALCLLSIAVWGQDTQPTPPPPKGPHGRGPMGGMMGPGGLHLPMGPWWKNSDIVQKINLSDAQVQQIDSIFQQNRDNLKAAGDAVRQAEQGLQPLVNTETEQMNDTQINAQLDAIAHARMNLEKTHAQMLLAIRKVLTLDQWTALQSMGPPHGFGPNGRTPRRPGAATQPPPPQF